MGFSTGMSIAYLGEECKGKLFAFCNTTLIETTKILSINKNFGMKNMVILFFVTLL